MEEFRVFRAIGLAFKSWFKNFIPFTITAAVLYSPVVAWILTYDPNKAKDVVSMVNNTVVYPIYMIAVAAMLLPPMLTYRVIQELNGKKVSMFASVKFGFRGILPAVIVGVIGFILGMIPVPLIPAIVNIVLTCMWFVAAPSAVAEKLNPISALSRSSELTRGRRWGIFGLLLMIGIVQIIIMVAYVAPLASKTGDDFVKGLHSAALVCTIILGVFQMFSGIVQAVSYALLRSDKDGMSHEQLASVFE
jgi:hypothetical protein